MQNDPSSPDAPLWRITQITDQLTFDAATGGGRVKRVNFRLFNGQSSYVDVPLSDFTPDKVGQLVAEHAEAMLQALSVSGPPITQTVYGQ